MSQAKAEVIEFPKRKRSLAPTPSSQPSQSLWEKYPLPFFNRDARKTWDVKPTGNYTADCKTGRQYAIAF
jgi:hypothetical protein